MKRKIVYSIIVSIIMIAFCSKVFAAGSSSNGNEIGDSVRNTAEGAVNVVENGAEHVGNAIDDGAEMAGNVARKATNGVVDAGETVANGTQNVARSVTNQVDPNANSGNTIFGLTNVAWMWIIVAIIFAVLIWVICKYVKNKNDE